MNLEQARDEYVDTEHSIGWAHGDERRHAREAFTAGWLSAVGQQLSTREVRAMFLVNVFSAFRDCECTSATVDGVMVDGDEHPISVDQLATGDCTSAMFFDARTGRHVHVGLDDGHFTLIEPDLTQAVLYGATRLFEAAGWVCGDVFVTDDFR